MPCFQELCRVQMTWLRAGDLCLQSKLGLNDYARRNVVAQFAAQANPLCQFPTKDRLLEAMLTRNHRSLLEESASPEDPLVRVCVPVTLYQFDPMDTTEGWLEAGIFERGASLMFVPHLRELAEIGEHFVDSGRSINRGCWGSSVCFHTLWVFKNTSFEPGVALEAELAGYVDLGRVPLGLFAETAPVRRRFVAPQLVQE